MKKTRSNSKEVKEAIKQHLIEISSNDDVEVETVDQAIQYIVNKFYNEMIKHNKHNKHSISYQDLFIYWLNGLALHTYYYTDDIINYLNSIGLYGKDEKAADLYFYLIFKEVKDHIFKIINEGIK